MAENYRFVRWQQKTIDQMGSAINTILVINMAVIGFCISYLLEQELYCSSKTFLVIGIAIIFLCTILLVFLTINRLNDFRLTTRTTKDSTSDKDKEKLRTVTDLLGRITWTLFWISITLFSIGQIIIAIGFGIQIL